MAESVKTCLVTRENAPRDDMLRFACSPNQVIVFDVAEKLPGRGFWTKADRAVVKQAVQKKLFQKAVGHSVQVDDKIDEQVEHLLKERCLSLLALCRKAGLFVFGYEAVKKAVGQQQAVVAFEAVESSERGQNKIFRPDDHFPIYSFFTKDELGRIAGLDEVVHVALLSGKLSKEAAAIGRKISLYMNGHKRKG